LCMATAHRTAFFCATLLTSCVNRMASISLQRSLSLFPGSKTVPNWARLFPFFLKSTRPLETLLPPELRISWAASLQVITTSGRGLPARTDFNSSISGFLESTDGWDYFSCSPKPQPCRWSRGPSCSLLFRLPIDGPVFLRPEQGVTTPRIFLTARRFLFARAWQVFNWTFDPLPSRLAEGAVSARPRAPRSRIPHLFVIDLFTYRPRVARPFVQPSAGDFWIPFPMTISGFFYHQSHSP